MRNQRIARPVPFSDTGIIFAEAIPKRHFLGGLKFVGWPLEQTNTRSA